MHEKVKAQIAHIDSEGTDKPDNWSDGTLEIVDWQDDKILVQIVIGDTCAAAIVDSNKINKPRNQKMKITLGTVRDCYRINIEYLHGDPDHLDLPKHINCHDVIDAMYRIYETARS